MRKDYYDRGTRIVEEVIIGLNDNTPVKSVIIDRSNITEALLYTKKNNIEFIHLQTNTIDFLNSNQLPLIKGISLQYSVNDITPVFSFNDLTYLHLPIKLNKEIDFSLFPKLISLGIDFSQKYKNLNSLKSLKILRGWKFKKKDFKDFSELKSLEKINLYTSHNESFIGLENLQKLKSIDIDRASKLKSLNGINKNLERLNLRTCRNLKDASHLAQNKSLKWLFMYQIDELNSIAFLDSLINLEYLGLYPTRVGVKDDDYYPLIRKLKQLDALENLKSWKPLNEYLSGSKKITKSTRENKSELEYIKENLRIKYWVDKEMPQYTEKNCLQAESIFIDLIDSLRLKSNLTLEEKMELIKKAVLALNKLNSRVIAFIETGEREDLCDLFDDIAEAVGIDLTNFKYDIAYQWRKW